MVVDKAIDNLLAAVVAAAELLVEEVAAAVVQHLVDVGDFLAAANGPAAKVCIRAGTRRTRPTPWSAASVGVRRTSLGMSAC